MFDFQYYDNQFTTTKEQREFEKNLFNKTHRANGNLTFCIRNAYINLRKYIIIMKSKNFILANISAFTVLYTCDKCFLFVSLAEIIMFEGLTCVYRSNVDLFFYVIGNSNENEV